MTFVNDTGVDRAHHGSTNVEGGHAMRSHLTTTIAKACGAVAATTGLTALAAALLNTPAGAAVHSNVVNGGPAHNQLINLVAHLHIL
jgi:hypothetical protein